MVICYLLSWLFEASVMLGNVPYFTIFSFEIYRLFTSPFVGNSIIDLVMILMFFPTMGGRMEASLGSASYLVLMATLTLVTNLLFIVICLSFYLFGMVTALFFPCAGFWNVLFALITIECMQVPDQPRRMFMLPVDIPSKYFPLVLYLLFILFSGPILSYLLAIGVGFLYSQGYLDKLKPTSYYLEGLESQGGMLHSISRSKGWILAGAAIGHDAWVAANSEAAGGAGASWANGSGSGASSSGANAQGGAGAGGAGGDSRANPVSFASTCGCSVYV
jgi:membrane associated rhomboid family serine protease